MAKLTGKIAVVTGATGGLGKAVVQKLLDEGATVIGTHGGSKKSDEIVKQFGTYSTQLSFREMNSTDSKSVKAFVDSVKEKNGSIHIICNLVGGITGKKEIQQVTDDEWNSMFYLNVFSAFYLIRQSIDQMKQNGYGRIVTIGAMPSITAEPEKSAYAASKAALIALTSSVAQEVKRSAFDITANVIVPSIILTEENKKWGSTEEQKKWVSPEEIAVMISYLCTTEARSINGQIIQMYGKV